MNVHIFDDKSTLYITNTFASAVYCYLNDYFLKKIIHYKNGRLLKKELLKILQILQIYIGSKKCLF